MTVDISTEAIRPQLDQAFRKDLIDALGGVVTALKEKSTGKGERPLQRAYTKLSGHDKRKLMAPIVEAIKKHTNLAIRGVYIWKYDGSNAYVNGAPMAFLTCPGEHGTISSMSFRRNKQAYYEALKKLTSLAADADRRGGKLISGLQGVDVSMSIADAYLDGIDQGKIAVENVVGVILHELGHVVDCIMSAHRMYAYSALAEEVIDYQEHHPDYDTVVELLTSVSSDLKKYGKDKSIVRSISADIYGFIKADKPITTTEIADSVRGGIVLYQLAAGEIMRSLGKVTDSADTHDTIRGAERRADRYGDLQGGESFEELVNSYYDPLQLAWATGLLRGVSLWVWRSTLVDPRNTHYYYDPYLERLDRMLKEQYTIFRSLEDQDPALIKSYVERTQKMESALDRLKRDIGDGSVLDKLAQSLGRYGWRAMTLPFARSRFSQDDAIARHLHDLTHNPLHYYSQRITGSES